MSVPAIILFFIAGTGLSFGAALIGYACIAPTLILALSLANREWPHEAFGEVGYMALGGIASTAIGLAAAAGFIHTLGITF